MVAMVPFYLEIQTKECSCGGYKSSFHHWSHLEGNSHEYIFIACMNQRWYFSDRFLSPCLSFFQWKFGKQGVNLKAMLWAKMEGKIQLLIATTQTHGPWLELPRTLPPSYNHRPPQSSFSIFTPYHISLVKRVCSSKMLTWSWDILSHPGVLFKSLILLVNNYTQLYVHMRCCPNNTQN